MHWTSFCGDAVKVVYLVHDPTWRAATLFWITELVDRVPAVPGYPEFPMAKFVKTPSLHACSWLGIFSKSSPFSGSFEIHSKWCNLQIHPSPDPSRKTCAVPGISCLEHGIGGELSRCEQQPGWPDHPIVPRKPFPYSNKDCLVSDHSINSGFLGACGHCTCLYPHLPTIRNLSVFMADALEAALPVLRRRRHSKDTCCWADASTVMRS